MHRKHPRERILLASTVSQIHKFLSLKSFSLKISMFPGIEGRVTYAV